MLRGLDYRPCLDGPVRLTPAFYSSAYPEPPGFADVRVRPGGAFHGPDFREFIPRVRESSAPDETLLEFLQSTYEAAADLEQWDRAALERGSPLG